MKMCSSRENALSSDLDGMTSSMLTEPQHYGVIQEEQWQLPDLPTDAMNVVWSYLTLADYQMLSLTCRRVYAAVTKASHLFMEDYVTTTTTITTREASDNTGLQQQHRALVRFDAKSLQRLLSRYGSLTSLHLRGLAPVGDSLFALLNQAAAAETLTTISLYGVSLTYWCTDQLTLPRLQHLQLEGGSIRASLSCLFGSSAGKSCGESRLETLSLGQCSSLRDEQVADMVKRLRPCLKQLALNQCLRIKQPVLQFDQLEKLSLMGCFALTSLPRFDCPSLKSLDLSFCFRLDTRCIQETVNSLPLLEKLILIKCPGLHSLELESDHLQTLNINFCGNLRQLRLRCPQMRQMENVACSSLETCILDRASSLRDLNFSGLANMSRLELLAAQHLVQLNLAGCRRLDHCTIHCPKLNSVNVRGSRVVALRFCREVRQVLMQNWTRMPLQVP